MNEPTSTTRREQLKQLAKRLNWQPCELQHAQENADVTYGREAILRLTNGRQLRCPAYPAECDYVRVVQDGYELGYWTAQEVAEDAAETLGAILGCAAGPAGTEPPSRSLSALASETREVLEQAHAAFNYLSVKARVKDDREAFKHRADRVLRLLARMRDQERRSDATAGGAEAGDDATGLIADAIVTCPGESLIETVAAARRTPQSGGR